VELRLLGPVRAWSGGRQIAIGTRQQRLLLAVLALEANRPVPVHRLVDLLWEQAPPRSARAVVHTHVSRVRSALTGVSEVELVREGAAYALRCEPSVVDAHRFRALVAQARDEDDDERRVALLEEAAALWRGPALADVADEPLRERLCGDLHEERLVAAEDRFDALLRLGRHRSLVAELTLLAVEHPDRHRPVAQLMLALHRCGRTADALAVYDRARRRSVEQFGLDPAPELRRLHAAILHEGPRVSSPREGAMATRAGSTAAAVPRMTEHAVPRQLPAPFRAFVGRSDELARLDGLLTGITEDAAPAAVVVCAISGAAGIGKTALAMQWAHHVLDRFPDGQLYVNLRAFGPEGSALEPAAAIRGFLDALGVLPHRIPVDLDAQVALYRSLLAGRRILIVLDNARDSEQVRPLLPGASTCLVLVTSRNQLSGLVTDGAYPLFLDLLSGAEAGELLSRRIGPDRVAAEPQAVQEIITRCGRLPLALAIVAARAATHPQFPLHVLATELRDRGNRLDALTGSDPHGDLRTVFSWSYDALSPEAARLFRLLGLHPGPDLSVLAAASLAGLPPSQVRPLLDELTWANLLLEHTPGRYACHDLLRVYATQLALTTDSTERRRCATHRMLDHYLHSAHASALLLNPTRDPLALSPPRPGTTLEHPAGYDQALAWFTTEHSGLLTVVEHAAATGFDTHAWQLAWALANYLDRRGHWQDMVATGIAAVAAARRLADLTAQARAHRHLAHAHTRLRSFDEAHAHLRHALDLMGQGGDLAGQAHAQLAVADLWDRQGRYADGLRRVQQGLDLYRAAANRRGQATALNMIGWFHAQLGDHPRAIDYCQRALALFQELDDRSGQAMTWDSLGYAQHSLGHHGQAIASYRHAIDLYQDLGHRYGEADTLTRLGDTHHAMDNRQAAHSAWRQALTILSDLDHPDAEQLRAKLNIPDTER
jgi:DNA-binding SARP family transcriptional activator/tetratricopeptide (TPR) repeat protein